MSSGARRLCIGLTGGIGCGKSTVARLFEKSGVTVVDTDRIAHQLTQAGGEAIPAIASTFGIDYFDVNGALDRSKMRGLIFSDANAKRKLENILHPMILQACIAKIQANDRAPYVMLMAPLLLECPGFLELVQRVLLIDCAKHNQIARVKQRSGLDETQICAIIAQQMDSEERLARADDIIRNDGAFDDLTDQVTALHQYYLSTATKNTI